MKKEFVPYNLALELKELGFDEPCLAFYDGKGNDQIYFNSIRNGSGDYEPFKKNERLKWFGAPTSSQAFRWFRNQFGLYAWVKMEYGYDGFIPTYVIRGVRQDDIPGGPFNTYEEAELACLRKLIQIVKNK